MDIFTDTSARALLRQSLATVQAMAGNRPPATTVVDGRELRILLLSVAREAHLVTVPANRRPWTATGIRVRPGDRVTWLAWGRAFAMTQRGIGAGPSFGMLCRVGDGPALMSARPTFTFTADREGEVQFGGRLPAELQSNGDVTTDRIPFQAIRGGFTVVVAIWPSDGDPQRALAQVAAADSSGLCAIESQRLTNPPHAPNGWFHHPLLGHEDVYTEAEGQIDVDCRDTVAIIRHPVDVALTDNLRLRWSWRVDDLPAAVPENTMFTHDYVSIAVEFDDGRDLTWQWSSSLPLGLAYPCPLDHWRRRETHIVVRSGRSDLGTWVSDERPAFADHRAAIGGAAPARVVAIWLIAVSLHMHQTATAAFRGIALVDGSDVTSVL
ncbi:DUF3047 domain-containing protein [Smaragdicoccus niigatensis]|uniref:DUF3047 domain-containing protein n=1 Tax=Smaragdicoccus niigatensis TaxID=359359 RepID=UPI000377808D|nr:DUF3047 domain-containing protein [Smaragdicoccus niigatensis]